MDRRYMRGRYDDDDRGRGPRRQRGRGYGGYGGEPGRDTDPRRLEAEFGERGAGRGPSEHGYGPYQRDLYGRDQRDVYQPSAGVYDRPGEQDWRGAPEPGLSGPGRGDWRELYSDQSYPDRRGFGWGDYDTRSDYDRDMPSAYRDRDYRGQSDYGRRGDWSRRHERYSDDRGYRSARSDRNFFERASDEVASWFGDEEAERRRDRDYRGYGPKTYQRSDARIQEDVNDALTDDRHVDASEITVTVENSEVTLDGIVDSRRAKRHAEDCAESVSGVHHVQNNLRVKQGSTGGSQGSGTAIPS